jgi:hypothetical protein
METLFHPSFERKQAPETGRAVIQLTHGRGTCYPLYYFIPSMSSDGRYLVYHQVLAGEVQLYVLDLTTAQSRQLTHAQNPTTGWQPWNGEQGHGVLDYRSVLNPITNEVLFFDDNAVRAVQIESLQTRTLFTLPADRAPIGQNCVTPDGRWFVYIHADRARYAALFPSDPMPYAAFYRYYWEHRGQCKGTCLAAYNLETGEQRTLVNINSPIHHVLPYGNEHLLFCHPASENGMLLTDLRGGWYTHLRTQDNAGGCVCHFLATAHGIAYEVHGGTAKGSHAGLYQPLTHQRCEFPLPAYFAYTHTGNDPLGRLWFFETLGPDPLKPTLHEMYYLAEHREGHQDTWVKLSGHWPNYGGGQNADFHPQITLDRRWLLFAAGDPRSQSNQLFLLDVADLQPTRGISVPT